MKKIAALGISCHFFVKVFKIQMFLRNPQFYFGSKWWPF